jgi:hypothetical protein
VTELDSKDCLPSLKRSCQHLNLHYILEEIVVVRQEHLAPLGQLHKEHKALYVFVAQAAHL